MLSSVAQVTSIRLITCIERGQALMTVIFCRKFSFSFKINIKYFASVQNKHKIFFFYIMGIFQIILYVLIHTFIEMFLIFSRKRSTSEKLFLLFVLIVKTRLKIPGKMIKIYSINS